MVPLSRAILLLAIVCAIASSCAMVNAQATVKITSPLNNGEAGPTQQMTGTAPSISSGQTLWIFVYVPSVQRWYPQTPPVTVENDGSWTYRPGIGTSADNGKIFLLQAVIADSNATTAVNDYLNSGPRTGWPGMRALPAGASIADQVSVTRVPVDVPTPKVTPTASLGTTPSAPPRTSSAPVPRHSATTTATSTTPSGGFPGLPGFSGPYGVIALIIAFVLAYELRRRN
jgi:hypothetical protein